MYMKTATGVESVEQVILTILHRFGIKTGIDLPGNRLEKPVPWRYGENINNMQGLKLKGITGSVKSQPGVEKFDLRPTQIPLVRIHQIMKHWPDVQFHKDLSTPYTNAHGYFTGSVTGLRWRRHFYPLIFRR